MVEYYVGNVYPFGGGEEEIFDLCVERHGHFMYSNASNKGQKDFEQVKKDDILILGYKSDYVAFGKVESLPVKENDYWSIIVQKWIYYDKNNPRKGFSNEGIGNTGRALVVKVDKNFALAKMKGIDASSDLYRQIVLDMKKNQQMEDVNGLLENKKNLILTGAPGTGKTYTTAEIAVALCDENVQTGGREAVMNKYKDLVESKQIVFTTFHQSLDYEEFVEGLKPDLTTDDKQVIYKIKAGIFKQICDRAEKDGDNNYVLIIDEINRGNISKIFGELITLLEKDKRIGEENKITVTLPYSQEKFGVPKNLYIIGTMNTADRSIGQIDYALRRRFVFVPLKAEEGVIKNYNKYDDEGTRQKALALFNSIEAFFKEKGVINEDLDVEDLMVGHSYFLCKTKEQLKQQLEYEIIPLIKEYVKDGIIMVDKKTLTEEFGAWEKVLCENIR